MVVARLSRWDMTSLSVDAWARMWRRLIEFGAASYRQRIGDLDEDERILETYAVRPVSMQQSWATVEWLRIREDFPNADMCRVMTSNPSNDKAEMLERFKEDGAYGHSKG
jgi:hypothetical protein